MVLSRQSDRFFQRMALIPKAVKEAVQPALLKSGQELQAEMRNAAPADTGALRDSISVTLPGQSTPAYSQPGGSRVAKENEVIVSVGNNDVRYGHLVEWGSIHGHAQPFFFPSYRKLKKRITGRIKRAVSKAVKDHWGSK